MRFLYLIYLNVLLLCLITRQLPAQIPVLPAPTSEIAIAERAFMVAQKDTNHWKERFTALFYLEDAYAPFLDIEYAKYGFTYHLTESFSTQWRKETFNLIHEFDSLKALRQYDTNLQCRLYSRWNVIYRYKLCNDNWNDLADQLLAKDLPKSLMYRLQNYSLLRRLKDTTSSFFIQQVCSLVECQNSAAKAVENTMLLNAVYNAAYNQYVKCYNKKIPTDSAYHQVYWYRDASDAQATMTLANILRLQGDNYLNLQKFTQAETAYTQSLYLCYQKNQFDIDFMRKYVGITNFRAANRCDALLQPVVQISTLTGILRLYQRRYQFQAGLELLNNYWKSGSNPNKNEAFGKEKIQFALAAIDFCKLSIDFYKPSAAHNPISVAQIHESQRIMSDFVAVVKSSNVLFEQKKQFHQKGMKEAFGALSLFVEEINWTTDPDIYLLQLHDLLFTCNLMGVRAELNRITMKDFMEAQLTKQEAQKIQLLKQQKQKYASTITPSLVNFNFKTKSLPSNSIEKALESTNVGDILLFHDYDYDKIKSYYQDASAIIDSLDYKGTGYNYVMVRRCEIDFALGNYFIAKQRVKKIIELLAKERYAPTAQSIQSQRLENIWRLKKTKISDVKGYFEPTANRILTKIEVAQSQSEVKKLTKEIKDFTYASTFNDGLNFVEPFIPDPINYKIMNVEALDRVFDATASFLCSHLDTNAVQALYNMILMGKGMDLAESNSFHHYFKSVKDSSVQKKMLELIQVQRNAYLKKPNVKQYYSQRSLYSDTREALAKIAPEWNAAYRATNKSKKVRAWLQKKWQHVQNELQPQEVAIEIIHFRWYNGYTPTDSIVYYAVILRKDEPYPTVLRLFAEKAFSKLLDKTQSSDAATTIEGLYVGHAEQLYQFIWQPLEISNVLKNCKTIYLASSGLLHRISFAALRPDTSQPMIGERYRLEILNSTRELHVPNTQLQLPQKNLSAVLFGDVQYNFDSTSLTNGFRKRGIQPNLTLRSMPEVDPSNCNIDRLDASRFEVEQIDRLLRSKSHGNIQLYTGFEASEEVFRSAVHNEPTIIHCSTHGIYRATESALMSNQALQNNYLLLAGCKRAICEQALPLPNLEDGLLTAAEVAHLALKNTQLVVLAACETGLGDLHGRDGVFGLARAFKLAGATYQLVSLWKVQDAETADFMSLFYENALIGVPIQEAFFKTQMTFKHRFPNEPHKWAAWVLIH
jgi:CHAT domain-containing protein